MACAAGFRQEIATQEVPAMTDLWFAAFTDPAIRRPWPQSGCPVSALARGHAWLSMRLLFSKRGK